MYKNDRADICAALHAIHCSLKMRFRCFDSMQGERETLLTC